MQIILVLQEFISREITDNIEIRDLLRGDAVRVGVVHLQEVYNCLTTSFTSIQKLIFHKKIFMAPQKKNIHNWPASRRTY